jgi:hypothetical protein
MMGPLDLRAWLTLLSIYHGRLLTDFDRADLTLQISLADVRMGELACEGICHIYPNWKSSIVPFRRPAEICMLLQGFEHSICDDLSDSEPSELQRRYDCDNLITEMDALIIKYNALPLLVI